MMQKDATVIPSSVVQRGPQGTYAYVIKPDETVEMRPIKLGRTEANFALVESGLKASSRSSWTANTNCSRAATSN